MNSLVGELVNDAVQKAQEEENDIIETEETVAVPVLPPIEPIVSENKAEEIPAMDIEPEDRIEIVTSSAEIEDEVSPSKVSIDGSEEKAAIEEAVKSLSMPSKDEEKSPVEEEVQTGKNNSSKN